jgi:hypothetical protein
MSEGSLLVTCVDCGAQVVDDGGKPPSEEVLRFYRTHIGKLTIGRVVPVPSQEKPR